MRRTKGTADARRDKDVYLYNLAQAQFFLDHSLRPVAIGRGSGGMVFLKFKRDAATEEVFQNWNDYVERIREKENLKGDGDDDKKKTKVTKQ